RTPRGQWRFPNHCGTVCGRPASCSSSPLFSMFANSSAPSSQCRCRRAGHLEVEPTFYSESAGATILTLVGDEFLRQRCASEARVYSRNRGIVIAAHTGTRCHQEHLQGRRSQRHWKSQLTRHVLDNAQVLHEDIDGASRRVITVEHMGYAVFEHPGIASRPGNDLVHLAQVEALLSGKSNCLTRRRDVHPSEKLFDLFEGRAEADFRAKIVHLRRHGLERRTSLHKSSA